MCFDYWPLCAKSYVSDTVKPQSRHHSSYSTGDQSLTPRTIWEQQKGSMVRDYVAEGLWVRDGRTYKNLNELTD